MNAILARNLATGHYFIGTGETELTAISALQESYSRIYASLCPTFMVALASLDLHVSLGLSDTVILADWHMRHLTLAKV